MTTPTGTRLISETPTEQLVGLAQDDEEHRPFWKDLNVLSVCILCFGLSLGLLVTFATINVAYSGSPVDADCMMAARTIAGWSFGATLFAILKAYIDRRIRVAERRARADRQHETYLIQQSQREMAEMLVRSEQRMAARISEVRADLLETIDGYFRDLKGFGDGRYQDGKADAAILGYQHRTDPTGTDGRTTAGQGTNGRRGNVSQLRPRET
jgi:hypothetical protein